MTLPDSKEIATRILRILAIYPKVSPSMLQISLNLPASCWKPVLESLVADSKVHRQFLVALSQTGRNQTYTILSSLVNDEGALEDEQVTANGIV